MADGETPTQETVEQGTPREVVSASLEAESPSIETQTAQMGGDEPLGEPEPITENAAVEATKPELEKPAETQSPPVPVVAGGFGVRELLLKAREAVQFRKRKKLDKVMGLFATRTSVTNDEVEKLLHVSDATATRYLSIFEKEGKIRQTGKMGRSVSYTKI